MTFLKYHCYKPQGALTLQNPGGCSNIMTSIKNTITNTTASFTKGEVYFKTGDEINFSCNLGMTICFDPF